MTLANTGGMPLTLIGAANRHGVPILVPFSSSVLDATNEACIWIGQLFWEDYGTHTVDTSGASAIQMQTASVTWANGSTTARVGLAAVDMTTGPPGRASNTTDVINFDVYRVLTGGAGVSANAWNTFVPNNGSKIIAHGDFVAAAVQITNRAGVDLIQISNATGVASENSGSITNYTGGSYASFSRCPNVVISASDGSIGFFSGSCIGTAVSTQAWNSGSSPKEYGNYLLLPYPARVHGIAAGITVTGDLDLVLYSDPLGTPVAQRTVSIDVNTVTNASDNMTRKLFASPYDLAANTPYAISMKPGGTNISASYIVMNSATHQKSWDCSTNAYAINRVSGAFSAQNSGKDRFAIGLLVSAFESGGGGGRVIQVNSPGLVS